MEVTAKNMRRVRVYELPRHRNVSQKMSYSNGAGVNKARTDTTASSVTKRTRVGRRRVGCISRTMYGRDANEKH